MVGHGPLGESELNTGASSLRLKRKESRALSVLRDVMGLANQQNEAQQDEAQQDEAQQDEAQQDLDAGLTRDRWFAQQLGEEWQEDEPGIYRRVDRNSPR